MITKRLNNNQEWEKKLFSSNRLTPGQMEDLHKVVVFDFYQSNGGKASFAKFWDYEEDGQELKSFLERYSLIKWELLALDLYSTVDIPAAPFTNYSSYER